MVLHCQIRIVQAEPAVETVEVPCPAEVSVGSHSSAIQVRWASEQPAESDIGCFGILSAKGYCNVYDRYMIGK